MPQVFVIMPFGTRTADLSHKIEKIDFDSIYANVIKPSVREMGWDILRIDEVVEPGLITNQFLKELLQADVVLGEVSLPNPNVYYELGIRQAISTGGTLLMALEGSTIPFDISHQRMLSYTHTPGGFLKVQEYLRRFLEQHIKESEANPVRSFLESIGAAASPKLDAAAFEQELRGRVQRAQNREQLISVWKWAQNLSPLPALPLISLAKRLGDVGEWSLSVEVLRASLLRRPDDFELHRELGWHLRHLGPDYEDEALHSLQEALRLNPSDPETLGMIGGLLKRQGKYQEAWECYTKGVTIAPNSPYMLVNQAAMKILSDPQNPKEGIDSYKKLITLFKEKTDLSKDEWFRVVLAEAWFAVGNVGKAKAQLEYAMLLPDPQKSLRSVSEQIELLGNAGFRPENAKHLVAWITSRIDANTGRIEVVEEVFAPEATIEASACPIFLHLSDIHFGSRPGANGDKVDMHRFSDEGDYSRTLNQHLKDEFISGRSHFKQSGERLHLIVSGDLTYTATANEFRLVEKFLNDLCADLSIDKSRVFIVPGNHDINWDEAKIDKSRRFDNFVTFLDSFYGAELFRKMFPRVTWDFKVNTERPEPKDIVSVYHDSKLGLLIVGLNSCVYEDNQHHYGFVGGKQMRVVSELMDELRVPAETLMVAVFHHHLHPFPEPVVISPNTGVMIDISTIRDAGLIERDLEKLGFDLVLHGHKHKAQIRETKIRNRKDGKLDGHALIVCGAGSTGVNAAELGHNDSNQYELIEVLRLPRKPGVDFLKIEWRELAVSPEAEWTTTGSWVIRG